MLIKKWAMHHKWETPTNILWHPISQFHGAGELIFWRKAEIENALMKVFRSPSSKNTIITTIPHTTKIISYVQHIKAPLLLSKYDRQCVHTPSNDHPMGRGWAWNEGDTKNEIFLGIAATEVCHHWRTGNISLHCKRHSTRRVEIIVLLKIIR